MRELIFLKPVVKKLVWGEELWGVSAHPEGDCEILNGKWKGRTLSELWDSNREIFGGIEESTFPLLVKFINTKSDLSIQVHPDDSYALIHENQAKGKNECWYILDCEENATIILGHTAKSREELKEKIAEGKWDELLREVPIQKGDFIQIDAGTIHALKGGTTLIETQQNSVITYRLYDYGRLVDGKLRELHVDKAVDVIRVPERSENNCMVHAKKYCKNQLNLLINNDYYISWKLEVEKKCSVIQNNPFLIISVLKGEGRIDGTQVKEGDYLIVPFEYGEIQFEGIMELICSTYQRKKD